MLSGCGSHCTMADMQFTLMVGLICFSSFAVLKRTFVSFDPLEVCLKSAHCCVVINWNETFFHRSGTIRPTWKNILHVLLLICSDMESCPGLKVVRKNQAKLICQVCQDVFHEKCVHVDLSSCCLTPNG